MKSCVMMRKRKLKQLMQGEETQKEVYGIDFWPKIVVYFLQKNKETTRTTFTIISKNPNATIKISEK